MSWVLKFSFYSLVTYNPIGIVNNPPIPPKPTLTAKLGRATTTPITIGADKVKRLIKLLLVPLP